MKLPWISQRNKFLGYWPSPVSLASDLILWGFCLLALAGIAGFFWYREFEAHQQVITLSFNDANEISKGSIVRFLGLDVGFVKRVDVLDDHVRIVLRTVPNAPKIPSGSLFTINFTGLAGAKTIEIIPPSLPVPPDVQGKPLYYVEAPIRLRQALQYQIDIAKALQAGAENFADFFGRQQPIDELQHNIHQADRVTAHIGTRLAHARSVIDQTNQDMHQTISKVNTSLGDFNDFSRHAVRTTEPTVFGPNMYQVIGGFSRNLLLIQNEMASIIAEDRLERFNQKTGDVSKRLIALHRQASPAALVQHLENSEQELVSFSHGVERAERFFDTPRLPALRRFNQNVRRFNERFYQLPAVQWVLKLFEPKSKSKSPEPPPQRLAPMPPPPSSTGGGASSPSAPSKNGSASVHKAASRG